MAQMIYRESGTKALVEILSDETNTMERTVQLRCLHVFWRTALCPMEIGEEWEASGKLGHEGYWGWCLSEVTDELVPPEFLS